MSDERKIPRSRLGRFARMASVGMRTGASMLVSKDGLPAAKHAAEVLGTLRGLAAKVGQMASYVDGVVPEGHRDAYETAMRTLRSAAPRSSPAEIRAVIESDLGAKLESLFARWDDVPIASASIGQVHRATLHDGRDVAVKVQHPGIVRALESDLANAGILEGFVGVMGGRRFDSKGLFDVARTRFREELDYGLEAERQRAFREIHADCDRIVIPEVIDERSSARVLTTTFVEGESFEQACTHPEPERLAWAQAMWRFVFKGTLIGGMFNADPHPGNFVFQPEGRVAFLDFGCVQMIPANRREQAAKMHLAATARDEAGFRAAVSTFVDARPGPLERLAQEYVRLCFEPLFASPYKITRPFAASLVAAMKEMSLAARSMKSEYVFTMPPEMLFMNRLQFGFYSVLARLDVTMDYAAIEREFLV